MRYAVTAPAITSRARLTPTTRRVRRRAILRRSTSRCRRASSFRAIRFGPPGEAGATVGVGGACFVAVPRDAPDLDLVFLFDFAMASRVQPQGRLHPLELRAAPRRSIE